MAYATDILGYTFDAGTYCDVCTERRYQGSTGWDAEGFDPSDYVDSEGNELHPIFRSESESDSPDHCADCGAFLENDLTSDGYAYVVNALADATGDAAVLRQWWEFYFDGFDEDDWADMARAWLDKVLPVGLREITSGDHTAVFVFDRPTQRDDFIRGRDHEHGGG